MSPRNAVSLTVEATKVLREIEVMSEENSTQNMLNEWPGPLFMPWYRALMELSSLMNLSKYDSNRDPGWIVAAMICASDMLLADGESPSLLSQHKRRSFVEPVYDGDRPDDLSDEMIAVRMRYLPEFRSKLRSCALGRALTRRSDGMSDPERGIGGGFGTVVRLTHRAVHRALTGEDTRGCRWCGPTNSTAVAGQQVNAQSTSELEREG